MDQFYKRIIDNTPHGYAFHRVIVDSQNNPIDYEFLEMNRAFEKSTGLSAKETIGKTYRQIFPEKTETFDWIGFYGKIALGGPSQYFEQYSDHLKQYYKGYSFSPEPLTFVTLFIDITQQIDQINGTKAVLKALNDVVFELDEDLSVRNVFTNDERHLFYSVDKIIGDTMYKTYPPEFRDQFLQMVEKAKQSKTKQSMVYPSSLPNDGRWFRADILKTDILGSPRIIINIIDITKQKNDEDKLKETTLRLQQLVEHTQTLIWEIDASGKYTYFSDTVEKVLGYTPEELVGEHFFYDLYPLKNRAQFKAESLKVIAEKNIFSNFITEACTKDGKVLTISTNGFPMLNSDGSLKGYRGLSMDITEQRRTNEALVSSEQKYRLITENTSDIIWVFNARTFKSSYISPSVMTHRGFTSEESINQSIEELIHPDSYIQFIRELNDGIQRFIADPLKPFSQILEVKEVCKDGSIIWVELSMKHRFNGDGDVEIVGVSRNITSRKQAESEIKYLSYHDQLTGVYNRTFYEEELNRLNTERNLPFTLLMFDVNGLKLTNDAFGHMIGDQLLISLADILKRICRTDDIIARIGGDEFAILLPKTNEELAKMIIHRINETIALTKPDKIKLSVAFGLKTKSTLDEDFTDIFKQAEDMMYRDKVKNQSTFKNSMIELMTTSLFEKYPEEREHAHQVSALSRKLGEALKLSKKEINDLEVAGLLHDIGKIGLDDGLIKKNEYIYFDQTPEFKRHSEIGFQITRSIFEFSHIAEVILAHHECYDGSGYPKGLLGSEIPLSARIVKMMNDYNSAIDRDGLNEIQAFQFISETNAKEYDPELIEVFKDILNLNFSVH